MTPWSRPSTAITSSALAVALLVACAREPAPPANPGADPSTVEDCKVLAARITHVYDLGSKGPRAQRGAVAGITSASYASEPIRSFAAEYARALASLVGDDSAAPQTDALARAASAVIDARHQLESACPTKTSPACAKVKAVVEESADTESTDATALAALVARMKTIRLADPALAKPFAALMDAEAALGSAAQGIRVPALDPRVASTMESADRRFEALCGPAPWR